MRLQRARKKVKVYAREKVSDEEAHVFRPLGTRDFHYPNRDNDGQRRRVVPVVVVVIVVVVVVRLQRAVGIEKN